MGLADRLTNIFRSVVIPAPLPLQDNFWPYLNFGGNLYPLNSLNQTLPGSKVEEVDGSFSGLVAGAYQANGVVFACMLVRMLLFSEARFQYQRMAKGRPGNLYGDPSLDILEHPWPGGTTGDLLAEILTYADLAGNAYIVRRGSRLAVLRPDHVGIVLDRPSYDIDAVVAGYVYYPGGKFSGEDSVFLQRSEVAHFAPIKDPLARYRGMSPLRPIIREFMADSAATSHKLAFFSNSATPNMVIKLPPLAPDKFQEAVKALREAEPAGRAAYKTLFLESGADISVVGANLRQMDFKQTQGAGETRIAAALGVPPIIVGLSEGLQAATYSNYGQARRRFADGTMHPLWRNIAGSLETIVPAVSGSRLWVDVRDIPFLREDEKDLADVQALQMQSLRTGLDAGWEADAVVDAVMANDLSLLKGKHTGLFSVQLQAPGSTKMPQGEAPGNQPVAGTGGPEKPAINPAATNGKPARDEMLYFLAGAASRGNTITVNPPANDVHVDATTTIAEGAISITTPDVYVDAPVTIEEGAVRVENPITVEPAHLTIEDGAVRVESPITVEPSNVTIAEGAVRVESTVEPAEVTVHLPEPPKTRKTVKRDNAGRISEVIEE